MISVRDTGTGNGLKPMAAGRTTRRWTAREVLCCPLPPVAAREPLKPQAMPAAGGVLPGSGGETGCGVSS